MSHQFIVGGTMSDESNPSAAVFDVNAVNMACSNVDEQNSIITNEYPIRTVEKELTSANASYVSVAVDNEDDVLIVDELKNVDS